MDYGKESLKKHREWRGKFETVSRVPVGCREELSLAYTPGVADACIAIKDNIELSFDLTRRWNVVPVVTDGTAVLGLGNIGPEAGMPVMEGKCALFKAFGGVDAIPLCIRSTDTDTIVNTIKLLQGSFGGINLEDIAAPRCFEIEQRLKEELEIPVFHDDQHGTAVVSAAALINALKIVDKRMEDLQVAVAGAGAAGSAIARFLLSFGVKDVILCDRSGIICDGDPRLETNVAKQKIAKITNLKKRTGTLADAMKGADLFVGVSGPNLVSPEMVKSMADKAIVFSCANPIPEITRDAALEAGATVVGTGSSAQPNQINNVLVFPGLFRGALDVRARDINMAMMQAASRAIASVVSEEELSPEYIIPYAWDKRAHEAVASAVAHAARATGVARI